MQFRWPFMTKARHEHELGLVRETSSQAIRNEYNRALAVGREQVHAWARDASAKFFYLDAHRAKGAAIAAFEQAVHQFNPAGPSTLTDGLTKPANVEEAIDAVTGTERTATLGVSAPGRDASGRGHIRPV